MFCFVLTFSCLLGKKVDDISYFRNSKASEKPQMWPFECMWLQCRVFYHNLFQTNIWTNTLTSKFVVEDLPICELNKNPCKCGIDLLNKSGQFGNRRNTHSAYNWKFCTSSIHGEERGCACCKNAADTLHCREALINNSKVDSQMRLYYFVILN